MISASTLTGSAANISTKECCLTKAVDRQMVMTNSTMNALKAGEASRYLSHV